MTTNTDNGTARTTVAVSREVLFTLKALAIRKGRSSGRNVTLCEVIEDLLYSRKSERKRDPLLFPDLPPGEPGSAEVEIYR